ncbi:MAG: rod shape-determining protein RodA [Anaerolineae bacterium]|nr:MAG: rod shape-determining protein RodA [Anaerolineae bacterium]
MVERSYWRYFDYWLLAAVALLTMFGIVMIRSAIAGNIELTDANIVQKQIIFAVAGFGVILLMAALDYRLLAALSRPLYAVLIVILIVLNLVGGVLFGSARWFVLGPILIQPSELGKIVIILILADYLARHQHRILELRTVLTSLAITLGMVVWILLQPDLSTSIVIFVIWFALVWAAGLDVRLVGIAAAIGIVGLAIGIPLMLLTYDPNNTSGLIKPYQVERIINFLFPDPNARFGAIYNVQQALISIGSGGLFGQGYGSGTQVQLRFLKVRHSDFIFSALAEEFGFVGTITVIGLLLFVIWRCLRAARLAADTFGALICYGVATILAFQAIINVGMNLKLLPVTGLPLPFISYGGSALLSLLLGIGLVESVVMRHRMNY